MKKNDSKKNMEISLMIYINTYGYCDLSSFCSLEKHRNILEKAGNALEKVGNQLEKAGNP